MTNANLWDTGLALVVAAIAVLVGGFYAAVVAFIVGVAMMVLSRIRKDEVGEPFTSIISRTVSQVTLPLLKAPEVHAESNIVAHRLELRGTRFTSDPANMVRWYSLHLFLKNDSDVPAKQVGAAIRFSRIDKGNLEPIKELDHGRWADGHYPYWRSRAADRYAPLDGYKFGSRCGNQRTRC